MKKLQVLMDEDYYTDLRTLASQNGTTMSALVRFAVDKTFEDGLDTIAGDRILTESLRNPSSFIPFEQYKRERRSPR